MISALVFGTILAACGGRYIDDNETKNQKGSIVCSNSAERKVLAYAMENDSGNMLHTTTDTYTDLTICIDDSLYQLEKYDGEVIVVITYDVDSENQQALEMYWDSDLESYEVVDKNTTYNYIIGNQKRYNTPENTLLLKLYKEANHYKMTKI